MHQGCPQAQSQKSSKQRNYLVPIRQRDPSSVFTRPRPEADMISAEIPQCSRHICELLFLIFVLGLNLLLLLNDWPLRLKRMGQRRTALRVIVRQSLPNLRHL
jgi:hypothetical protein